MTAPPSSQQWNLEPAVCPVCDGVRCRFLGFRGGWAHHAGAGIAIPVVRCRQCGTTYPNPTPKPVDHSHYDEADGYFGPEADDEVAIASFSRNLQDAEQILGRKGRLLDVGCGTGSALAAGERRGWQAVGVEPSIVFADEGRRRFGVDIRDGFFDPGDFAGETFDAIVFSGVLEHVFDPVALLQSVVPLLARDGLVYVDVPNESGWMQTAAQLYYRLRRRPITAALSPTFPPFHVVGFSLGSLRLALQRTGLQPVSIGSYPLSYGAMRWPLGLVAKWTDRAAVHLGRSGGLFGWAAKTDDANGP